MEQKRNWWPVVIVGILIIIIAGLTVWQKDKVNALDIKIGVITDLTGPAAYWGESTRVGAEIAKKELEAEGYKVNLIFEDYQLDTAKALTAAQKLVNIDGVDAIYAEFNPAAISVGSFLKNKNMLFVYDAAPTSPLIGNPYAYKTYLDYKEGCKEISTEFKNEGIKTMGVLEVNAEFGQLCLDGVKEVYPDVNTESYNLGDMDFSTQILKLNQKKVGAIINVGFEADTLNTLKVIKEKGLNIKYGTVDDTITSNVTNLYKKELTGGISFGFRDVSVGFQEKIKNDKLTSNYGAALAYTHIKQMVMSLSKCNKDISCVVGEMNASKLDDTIGFKGFLNHIAGLNMSIKKY